MYRNPDAPGLKPISASFGLALQNVITAPDAITELKADIAAIEAALQSERLSEFGRAKHLSNLKIKRAQLARWED